MPVEADPEHLVALALVPVGAGVDRRPRVDDRGVVGDVGLDRDADVTVEVDHAGEHLQARLAPGDTLADLGVGLDRLGGRVVLALAVRRRQPVDGGQEAEEREAGGLQGLAGLAPGVGADAHPQVVVRCDVGVDERVADARPQIVDDPLAETVARERERFVGDGCVGGRLRGLITQWGHHPPRSARGWQRRRDRLGRFVARHDTAVVDERPGRLIAAVRVTAPLGSHVLVLDALLEEDDRLEQRLRSGRAAGHVDVDRDDLVDALGDRVAVPVRARRSWRTSPSRWRTSARASAPTGGARPVPSCR